MGKKAAEAEENTEEIVADVEETEAEIESVDDALTRTSEAAQKGELTGKQIRAALKVMERKITRIEANAPKSSALEAQLNELRDSVNALSDTLKKKQEEGEEKPEGKPFDFFVSEEGTEEGTEEVAETGEGVPVGEETDA